MYRNRNRGSSLNVTGLIALAGIIVALVVLLSRFSPLDIFENYSDGSRAGVIVKISKKGVVCKTYEGELKVGTSATALPETWKFSASEQAAPALEAAMKSGKPVVLGYRQPLVRGFCIGDSDYRIMSLEEQVDN